MKYNKKKALISLVSCITLSVILLLLNSNNNFILLYYFFILDNVFEFDSRKTRKALIFCHMSGFMLYLLVDNILINKIPFYTDISSYVFGIFVYIIVLFVYICIHEYRYEMNNLKMLNCSLIDYSFKEREHLILNERNRISQELHDSLGHSLMALSMNVKYIKAIKDREKINHEINELESLIGKSIQSLRETVYNLRKLDENFSLHNQITSIISKFNKLNIIKITLDYDDNVEKSSITIKNILISTIKESITNSLKHGNSTKIFISIKLISNTMRLIIKDNGDGCSCIIKSEGLAGIENRFKTFNGTINFITSPNKGFTITASIPEVIIDD
ncbi:MULTISPECIES: sensor histidine kinase [Clostridium]|uniref:histidine kinase n=1 Tax=Clostridium lapidicellarium TaxID=3240931 RepID=A0ABV4DZA6_9CLOT|nr:sensor histidine kinase [uncultured Clostridium sp.]